MSNSFKKMRFAKEYATIIIERYRKSQNKKKGKTKMQKKIDFLKSWGYNEGEINEAIVRIANEEETISSIEMKYDGEKIEYSIQLTEEGSRIFIEWGKENGYTLASTKNIDFADDDISSVEETLKEFPELWLVNLTPHDINICLDEETCIVPRTGTVARVAVESVKTKEVHGVPIFAQEYGEIENLPEPRPGVYYLVSLVVRKAAESLGRSDLLSPDTSPSGAVRDKNGMIIGVRGLVK